MLMLLRFKINAIKNKLKCSLPHCLLKNEMIIICFRFSFTLRLILLKFLNVIFTIGVLHLLASNKEINFREF